MILFSSRGEATESLNGQYLLIKYEGDQHYKVHFDEKKVKWECVQGEELGKTESDVYKSSMLTNNTHVINWQENDGTFVVLTLDLISMKAISTGISNGHTWFRKGTLVKLNNKNMHGP